MKRLLSLYRILSPEEKEYFHINSFDDMITWGGRWLEFFGELKEELIDPGQLNTICIERGMNLQSWQEDFLERILQIYQRYDRHITALGFDDEIFLGLRGEIIMPSQYERFVFVSQYYYSGLEKKLINHLEDSGRQVTILFQGTQDQIDEDKLSLGNLDLALVLKAGKHCAKHIEILRTATEDQMILCFLKNAGRKEAIETPGLIIDRLFFHKPYSHLFEPQEYGYRTSLPLMDTPLAQMLNTIATHLEALIRENGMDYLPLRELRESLSQKWFWQYFQVPEPQGLQIHKELDKLIEEDYLYVDTDLRLFALMADRKKHFAHLAAFLKVYFALLQSFDAVLSIAGLFDLVDTEGNLQTQVLNQGDLSAKTDIMAKFWERSANFLAIEELGIVADWHEIYGGEPHQVPVGIIRLFLQYLKTATLSYRLSSSASSSWRISSLMDSRNQSAGQV
ncbi:MAG: hypothetical protein U1C33_01065, partial [Candidatus Cloacimonadaceae bacterium]|nr:hypothetical protein [Candidatus Cloacimonadaceae bacterium]